MLQNIKITKPSKNLKPKKSAKCNKTLKVSLNPGLSSPGFLQTGDADAELITKSRADTAIGLETLSHRLAYLKLYKKISSYASIETVQQNMENYR